MSNKSDMLRRYELRPFEMTQRDIENSRIGYEDMIFGKMRKALKAKRKQERKNRKKGRK